MRAKTKTNSKSNTKPKKKSAVKALKSKASKKMVKKTAKKVAKKTAKKRSKSTAKKVDMKSSPKKDSSIHTQASLLELIRITSTVIPDDIQKVILKALEDEEKNTTAEYAMNIIKANIELAKKKSQPLCQDTGTVIFYIYHPAGFETMKFSEQIRKAVVKATELGYLRQNSVDSLTGENAGTNLGPGHPSIHYVEHSQKSVEVKLMLKGGGCENVGAQYSLPNTQLGAGRDLDGVRKVILDAVVKAQGKGCGPGVLGVCIGGDRGDGYMASKKQLFRFLDDSNPHPDLGPLEKEITETCNKLGIGPMGFGGKTTLLGCKITTLNRLPASFFVSISYMCWAYRRQGIVLGQDHSITKWIY
ncbi:MAG: fumarate hydratase [Bacteriovoracaceae bacterium]